MTTIDRAQNRVAKFMIAGGQLEERLENFQLPEREVFKRRMHMLQEELSELKDAWLDRDDVAFVDAYGDLLYVLLGGVEEAGFDIEPVFNVIADANDAKIDWKKGRPYVTREDGKILKPEGWVGPESKIAKILGVESHG